jgi:hypothetical protein
VRPFQALRMRRPVVAGAGTLDSSIAFVNLTNTCTLPIPAGAVVNSPIVLYFGHSWQASGSVWSGIGTVRHSLAGSNYNGQTWTGIVDATDIARGTLTVNFAGNGYGIVAIVCLPGLPGTHAFRDVGGSRNGSGAASRTVTTGSSVVAGDLLVLFGSAWTATAATSSDLTSTLQSSSNANGSGVVRYGIAASGGAQSGTVNYAGSPGGDYQALIALAA